LRRSRALSIALWSSARKRLNGPRVEKRASETTSRTLIGRELSTSVDCMTKEGDGPAISISPECTSTVPAKALRRADLPAPLGPMTDSSEPEGTSRFTSVKATVFPYRTSRLLVVMELGQGFIIIIKIYCFNVANQTQACNNENHSYYKESSMLSKPTKKLILILTTLLAVASLVLTGCSDDNSTEASSSEEKPMIVVTTNILGDVVANIVGDNFDVEVIMPSGTDPHDFQASAKQVAKIMNADLLVVNGASFEEGMADVIEAAESDGVMIFEAISFVTQLEGDHDDHEGHDDHDDHEGHDDHDDHEGHDDHDDHEGHDDDDDHEGHDHGGIDPHFFTDPSRMAQVVEGLSKFLVANFPEVGESSLESDANAYLEQLEKLDAEVEQTLFAIPADARVLVTNHSVFEYFADRYDFKIIGSIIPATSTLSGASAQQIASLAEEIRSNQVTAIFVDASSSDSLAKALAGEVDGVKIVNLFTESLGSTNSSGSTYIDMVRSNSEAIASALLD